MNNVIKIMFLLSTLFLFSCSQSSLQQSCLDAGGKWIESAQECEGISEDACAEMGGEYDGCASACRNDPDADVCTKQCVQVCSF